VARYDPRKQTIAANLSTGIPPKPANLSTGTTPKPANLSAGPQSAAAPYREVIQAALAKGLGAQRIWQDLREEYGSATAMPR
jgi:hypothetical protein